MSSHAATHAAAPPAAEGGVEPQGINGVSLALAGLVSIVLTVVVIFAATALYYEQQNALDAERVIAVTDNEAKDVVLAQQGLLADYGLAEGGKYRIPIASAKRLVLEELAKKAK